MKTYILYFSLFFLFATQSNLCDGKLLHEINFSHKFSASVGKDSFVLKLTGEKIIDGTISFEIIQNSGKVIYKTEFKAIELIGYDFYDQKDISKKDYIIKRMNEFFNESNFSYPAVSENDKYDDEYSDKKNWEDIKSDSSAIGFTYLLGEENTISIAYSKKKKMVLEYFHCC